MSTCLPSLDVYHVFEFCIILPIADKHHVQLNGVVPDYIHATFVNVTISTLMYACIVYTCRVTSTKGIHCGSESHGEHY